MPKYTLHRTFTVATTKGHRIAFVKDVPINVPPQCVPDVLAIGAVAADGSNSDVIEEQVKPATQADPGKRESDILAAIQIICDRNERTDFMASGTPKEAAISRIVGYEVSKLERELSWRKYHELKAEAA